ncbi:hypothetical protein BH10ACI2_BH10ACI2_00690 [soil metagenome]
MIIRFGVSLISLFVAVLRIGMGYVPSSRIVKYGNITAKGNPLSFWITIAFLLLVSVIFFLLGCWSLVKYMRSK